MKRLKLSPWEAAEYQRLVATVRCEQARLNRSLAESAAAALSLGTALAQLRGDDDKPKEQLWRAHADTWTEYCEEILGYSPRTVLHKIGVAEVIRNITQAIGNALPVPLSGFAAMPLIKEEPEIQVAAYQLATADVEQATQERIKAALAKLRSGQATIADAQAIAQADQQLQEEGQAEEPHRKHREHPEAVQAKVEELARKLERPAVAESVAADWAAGLVLRVLSVLHRRSPQEVRERVEDWLRECG